MPQADCGSSSTKHLSTCFIKSTCTTVCSPIVHRWYKVSIITIFDTTVHVVLNFCISLLWNSMSLKMLLFSARFPKNTRFCSHSISVCPHLPSLKDGRRCSWGTYAHTQTVKKVRCAELWREATKRKKPPKLGRAAGHAATFIVWTARTLLEGRSVGLQEWALNAGPPLCQTHGCSLAYKFPLHFLNPDVQTASEYQHLA